MTEALRILVVDDSVVYRTLVSGILSEIPDVEVIGTASTGRIALGKIAQLHPHLVTLDLEMPDYDGLEVLRRLPQAAAEVGVVMLSAFTAANADATVEALNLGAFDFVLKPSGPDSHDNAQRLRRQLRLKVESFRRSRQIRSILSGQARPAAAPAAPPTAIAGGARLMPRGRPEAVVIGVSTGGPAALKRMLPGLGADFPAPVLVVQHMPPVFTRSLAEDLNRHCRLRVAEAADGQLVEPGWILIAPGGKQMRVERVASTPVVRLTDDPHENSCRPSADYLFRSVAEVYGGRTLGVLMTGMGSDGVAGFRQLHKLGAALLAQDEASCVVFGMPREPIREGIAKPLALDALAGEITRLVGQGAALCR